MNRKTAAAAASNQLSAGRTVGARAGSAVEFLNEVIRGQQSLGPTHGGAILAAVGDTGTRILAIDPPIDRNSAPLWLKQAAKLVHEGVPHEGIVAPIETPVTRDKDGAHQELLLYPVACAGTSSAVIAIVVSDGNERVLQNRRRQLAHVTRPLRPTARPHQQDAGGQNADGLQRAVQTAAAMNVHDRYPSAAMALCNEVACRWRCDRVSAGFLKGRYVRLEAMSQVEHFDLKTKIVHDVEAVMEECMDQDCEIMHPALPTAEYVSREAAEFSKRHGPLALVSLPLRRKGEACGALTLERPVDRPFTAGEIESLRLACDLCTPRLFDLRQHDRWFTAKIAGEIRRMCALAVGTQHTWTKLLAICALCAMFFIVLAKGPYRIEASFVLESEQRQVVCAPFDGFIESAGLEVGDVVKAGETVLATVDTAELSLRKAEAQAERETYAKQVSAAMRDGKTAEAQIARAYVAKIDAQIELVDYYLQCARITTPISGTIINGDLKRHIGAPVKTGDVLFELTPLTSLRAELMVPEEDIPEIVTGQRGRLATVSYPGRKIEFTIEQINPIAQVVDQKNVFRVRCRLEDTPSWLRPGMEGVAKVSIGKRSYSWIWTRKIVRWIRMKLWI